MTVRGWQASCTECHWNVHAVHREHAEAAKQDHQRSTGHRNVDLYKVTEGDPTARYGGGHLPPKA
jgi:hypothetical protein